MALPFEKEFISHCKKQNLESLWHIELENILGEMSAICGKGVSEK